MSEWRIIPDFPKYEITELGDVRNRHTKYVLNEVHNKTTGAYSYCLWKDGKSYHRNFWTLVYNAWPEMKPAEKWRTHPTYTGYEVSRDGEVRNKTTRHVSKPRIYKGQIVPKVRLKHDGRKVDVAVESLVADLYSQEAAA